MIEIVICDDDIHFLKLLDRKIRHYCNQKDIEFKVSQYNSAELLLQSNIHQVSIIFLDVKLANMNGIDIASMLRKRTKKFILIFVSGFLEYAPAGYKVNALRYVLKEQINILFKEAMDEAIKELGFFRTQIICDFVSGKEAVYTYNILFLESRLHTVYFHFVNSKNTCHLYDTLNSIQNQLPQKEFVRIHQSYLVNLKYFLDARNYRAKLTNNVELPISQSLFSEVKKQLFLYRGRM